MSNKFPELPKEKFVLVNENKPLRDKELVTKPRGFFADAMYRFSRNKGSIFGAIVIGVLVLYAIIAPICTPYEVSYKDGYYKFTLPKLFTSENIDFWDGCSNKSINETSFVYYYAMGMETGHNAIKRQEYSTYVGTSGGTMYNVRLDSYESTGMVYINGVTPEQYQEIQDYQDEHDVQIIYPTIDPAKRPEAIQDQRDANFWYETTKVDGKTIPVNYSFDEEGKLQLNNVYLRYTAPTLLSEQTFSNALPVKLEEKGDGYAIAFVNKVLGENGEVTGTKNSYFFVAAEEDNNIVTCVPEFEDASVFTIDETHKTPILTITGHTDSSLDGQYFFGLRQDVDSKMLILPISSIEDTTYAPFKFMTSETEEAATIVADQEYYFSVAKDRTVDTSRFLRFETLDGSISIKEKASEAGKILFSAVEGGFALKTSNGKLGKFISLSANGNDTTINFVSKATDASVWSYDAEKNSPYVIVNGHTDSSLDGKHYIMVDTSGETYSASIAHENTISDVKGPVKLYIDSQTPADSIENNGQYLIHYGELTHNYLRYYANGKFNGDNYFSKMRVEGEDNFDYSYAVMAQGTFEIRVNYHEYYCYYHQMVLKDGIKTPYFLFGTTEEGQDIFTCLASGARFSFLFAIAVATVNMVIGAIYGAIEGYYGGKIDMVMERIVEILSAVPFMIVITLLKYHMENASQMLILFIAFFLTGWIGESGTVRMQFYRFKNQEYVLASRTLGAKDWRIMFRHIFPNSLGTIITGSVLVIPGMIFSETSLSYLGIINLNSGSMTSVGTLLANAQPYLVVYPHMIIFPAVFISLLMLCFNLFGNGLRDAFNPSLRGTEE